MRTFQTPSLSFLTSSARECTPAQVVLTASALCALSLSACVTEGPGTAEEKANNLGTTLDLDGDGVPDQFDINGDGIFDGVGVDTNGDGVFDAIGLDTDNDGYIDALDYDGDGAPDPVVDLPGQSGSGGSTGENPSSGGSTGSGGGEGPSEEDCLGDALIDDFSSSATYSLFRPYNDGTSGGSMSHSAGFSAEESGAPGGMALHHSGSGYSSWGAGIGRKFDPPIQCKGRSTGIRFRAKGNGPITVAAPVSAIVPVSEGGSCTAAEACNNGHEKSVTLTSSFQTYEVKWSELSQLEGWGLPATFDAKSVLEILFAARPEAQPFDFWIDDIELIDNGSEVEPDPDPDPVGTGGGGGVDPVPSCALDTHLGEAAFNDWFKARRNSFYTYDNLCAALETFPEFANSGNAEQDKREIAAFFANVARETGELEYIEEINKGQPTYFGRGPIQLTHDYNYRAAGEFLGLDLLGDPGLVSRDGKVTWLTALWFWMKSDGAAKGTCHGAITSGLGFGQTINIINGGLECGGENVAARQRITYYTGYCSNLSVAPGSNLQCW